MSLADKILATRPAFTDVAVVEWGCDVRVQSLSGRERLALFDAILLNEKECEEAEADGESVARLDQMIVQLIFALRDPTSGDRLFDVADHDRLMDVGYSALEELFGAFVKLNMRTPVEAVETLKKSSN